MKKTYYDKITKKYQKELLSTLGEFISINSVYDGETANEENPFGVGVSKALNFIAEVAKKDGFEVTNYSNKVVEILYGEGDKNLTIMAHADVVPAGKTGWDQDPFEMVEKKGVLFGRGVADDKGPLLASYYALKALRDNGNLGGYKIRFLVGGNEESGSLGIEHYFHTLKKEQPTLGFSPDSDFPLIFAEKGIINFEVTGKHKLPGIISIEGGVASNSVIEKCDVKAEISADLIKFITSNYSRNEAIINTVDDITTISFIGKAAHGALPELGDNAGIKAIEALAKFYNSESLNRVVEMYKALDGSGYKCNKKSKEMGHCSSNVGLMSYKDGELKFVVNYRYVDTVKKEEILEKIIESNKPWKVKILAESPLLYYKKNSVLISTLMKSYQEETGDLKSKPLAIGGGTYAKEADNVVAFGMQFPGWESNMHSPGESVRKEDLFKGMAVYARAIVDLGDRLK